jgi:hypothetical protein
VSTNKEPSMTTTEAAKPESITESKPTAANATIHWAGATTAGSRSDLEQKFEAMRARNWITQRMVEQYMKHWHCTREAALERLLAKHGT